MTLWSDYEKSNDIILCTFSGAGGNGIGKIASQIKEINDEYRTRIYYGQGLHTKGNEVTIANHIESIYKEMKDNGKFPKIIFVGKSMGGCILHATHERLIEKDIKIDLFVAIDMSCWVSCHYGRYNEDKDKNENQVKEFDKDYVKELINFYQIDNRRYKGGRKRFKYQCGHPVRFIGEDLDEINININVRYNKYDLTKKTKKPLNTQRGITCEYIRIVKAFLERTWRSGNNIHYKYRILFKYKCDYNNVYDLCAEPCNACRDEEPYHVTHMTIDNCPKIQNIVTLLIKQAIAIDYHDEVEYPKCTLSYRNASGSVSGVSEAKQLSLGEHQDEILIEFKVEPTEPKPYKREITLTLNDLNETKDSISIQLPSVQCRLLIHNNETYIPISGTDHLDYSITDADLDDVHIMEPNRDLESDVKLQNPEQYFYRRVFVNAGYLGGESSNIGITTNIWRNVYKWGFLRKPIKCKIIAEGFQGNLSINGNLEIKNLPENINQEDYTTLFPNIQNDETFILINRGFNEDVYNADTSIKFTYKVRDSSDQEVSGESIIYGKSLLDIYYYYTTQLITDPQWENIKFRIREELGEELVSFIKSEYGPQFSYNVTTLTSTTITNKINDVLEEMLRNPAVLHELNQVHKSLSDKIPLPLKSVEPLKLIKVQDQENIISHKYKVLKEKMREKLLKKEILSEVMKSSKS